jgi:hypothetical protein
MLKTVLVGVVLVATAAAAHSQGGSSGTKRGPGTDPHEVVCVAQKQIGSRLNQRRVCRTRSEWAEHREEHKQEVERAQQQMQTSFKDPPI